jgi:hypothetical protein
MRRLALAAVVGSLVLAACTDESKQAPTEPAGVSQPSFAVDLTLQPCATTTWLNTQLALAQNIFPGGKGKTLLSSANEKLTDIYNLCKQNKRSAIAKAVAFDDWMFKKFQAKLLTTNSNLGPDVLTLFINVLNGVGINTSTVTPDLVTGDAGTGVFLCDPLCPTTPTTVFTTFFFAALQIPVGGFSETTLLIIDKKPDNTKLKNAQGFSQFPPFYDFNALNASNQHVLNTGKFAHVEMCLYFPIEYPPDIAIGHNPVFGAPGYPFEVLPSDDANALLGCGTELTSVNPGGLQGLAVSAWRAAKRGLTAVFLPQTLRAATLAVGGTGSKSGSAGSLSPFGIVAATSLEFTQTGDPTGQTFTANSNLAWQFCTKGCFAVYPGVRVVNADGTGVGGVEITVTLVPVGNSSGTLTTGEGGSTVFTDSESGIAVFYDLGITDPGTYKLKFSITGSSISLTSGSFTVQPSD